MGSRAKNIQTAPAAEAARRSKTAQDKELRLPKKAGSKGHATSRELRRGITEAQRGTTRKRDAAKSGVGGGGRSPGEAGRGKARGRQDYEEEEGQPLRQSSSGNTKRASVTRRPERESDVEEEEEEEEDETRERGKKFESTDSDDGEELQPAGPSPKKKKKNPKKGRL